MKRTILLTDDLDEQQLKQLLDTFFDRILEKMQAKGMINQTEATNLLDRKEELVSNLASGIASRGFKLENLGQEQSIKQMFMTVFNAMMLGKDEKLFKTLFNDQLNARIQAELALKPDGRKKLEPEDLKKLFTPEELKELNNAFQNCKKDAAEKLEKMDAKLEEKDKKADVDESNAQLLGVFNSFITGGIAAVTIFVRPGNPYQIPDQNADHGNAPIDDANAARPGVDPLGLKASTLVNYLQDASLDETLVSGLEEAMEGLQNEMSTKVNNPTPGLTPGG